MEADAKKGNFISRSAKSGDNNWSELQTDEAAMGVTGGPMEQHNGKAWWN